MEERDPRLEEALAKLAGLEEEPSAQRLAATREAVSRDTGLLSTLRQLPRFGRVALAGAALGGLALVVGLLSARQDLGAYPALRLVLEVGASAVLALLLANVQHQLADQLIRRAGTANYPLPRLRPCRCPGSTA